MNNLHIISRSDEPFENRSEAGRLLGLELVKAGYKGGVVIGIPRGGVVVAHEVARKLAADLDVIISRKIGAPGNPEFAIGAITENGGIFLNETRVQNTGYINEEANRQLFEIERRKKLIRSIKPKTPLQGKLVIVTDDGIATGATTQAALWAVRQEKPKKLVAAFPVAPSDSLMKLAKDADEIICLSVPPFFDAVGRFYLEFDQVSDDEVLEILKGYHMAEKT